MNKKFLSKGKVLCGATLTAAVFLTGCGSDLDDFVFTNTNPQVQLAPVAVNDAFNALGNATVNQAASGVLANDTINGATITSFDAVGDQGGTIVLNADGSFAYTPVFGFVGQEAFAYTITNSAGHSTATVTMTSTGEGFFVDNTAAPGGNGSQASPFNTLAQAIAAANSGDTIFVERGDGTSTGLSDDVTLPQGVNLIGEGTGLILSQTIVPQGQAPVINAMVTVSGDNTISGFIFDDVSDEGIFGDGFTNVTITNNTFTGEGGIQVSLADVAGAITISDNTFSMDNYADATDIDTAASGTCTFVLNNNTFQQKTSTADADDCFQIEVDGSTIATIQMNDNMFNSLTTGDPLERGLFLELDDDSATTLTASGNMAIFMYESWFELDAADQSTLTATLTGNVMDQNVIGDDPDVEISLYDDSEATMVFDNNSITDSSDNGIEIDIDAQTSLKLALRNNVITGSVNEAVDIDADNDSDFCGEITGNTFGADLVFDQGTTGNYDVEQFGDPLGDVLATLNTFNVGGIVVDGGPVNSVADGACLIP